MHTILARKLLLIEDNPGDAELVIDLLGGYEAASNLQHSQTLRDGLSILRSHPVDAVLLDLRLPDARGIESVLMIRNLSVDIPIVVLTGVEDDLLAFECLHAGAQDFISKDQLQALQLRRALGYAIARSAEVQARRDAEDLRLRLATIVENSNDAILSWTLEGIVVSWNQTAEMNIGRTQEDVIGRHLTEVLEGSGPEELAVFLRPALFGTAPVTVTLIHHVTREPVVLSVAVNPTRHTSGELIGYAGICRDITDAKRREEREREQQSALAFADRMVSIGALAAGVGHEINNPLAAIISNLELALREVNALATSTNISEDLIEELEDAASAAQRIKEIAKDLKTFSRDAPDESNSRVSLNEVVKTSARLVGNEMRHRANVVFELSEVPDVETNEARLGQVILNLLMNAAQAIPEGHRNENQITISTFECEQKRSCLIVKDTGVGMSKEVQEKVFRPFFTTKPIGVGTGLSLAISQSIVTNLGGELTFTSEVGKGSSFYLRLPQAKQEDAAPVAISDSAAHRKAAIAGRSAPRILIVDDEVIILQALRRILSAQFSVTVTESAKQGLEHLKANPDFDVILCDVIMPEMTALDFYTAVEAFSPKLCQHLIFMTGGAFSPSGKEFVANTKRPVIDKPFDIGHLFETIEEVLDANQTSDDDTATTP